MVINNLNNAFPEKSKKEITTIVKKFYRHFCDSIFESVSMVHMSEKQLKKRFTVKNVELLDEYFNQNKSVIAISGHYASWDWGSSLNYYSKHLFCPLYKPMHNKYFDQLFIRLREKTGSKVIANTQAFKYIFSHSNDLNIYWFIADQRPLRSEINFWTTFLNQDTPVFLGAEKMAVKTNFPVVFYSIQKIKRGYYEAEIVPVSENPKDTKEFEITEKHTRMLEEQIIKQPEYWAWSHNRWKHKKLD